ncbi:hypothetical protein KBC79_05855 [Candidatus Woesebacteria bacterium]|nr:hypothetical protein [Candidatus Woesebacteria bacterium]
MPAKSRLTAHRKAQLEGNLQVSASPSAVSKKNIAITPALQSRLWRIYLLAFAAIGYAGVWYMLHSIYPSQIADVLFPQSFLPLQLALLVGNFFAFSWLFLNSARGLRASIFVGIFLSLKLQHVELTVNVFLIFLAAWVLIEFVISLYNALFSSKDKSIETRRIHRKSNRPATSHHTNITEGH